VVEGAGGSPGEDPLRPDIELARPQTHGEEELQLQLALAMSREEADAEDTKKKSDDMRLTLAIQKSKADHGEEGGAPTGPSAGGPASQGGSALNDLVDLNFGGPQGPSPPQRTAASLDPWSPAGEGGGAGEDPWGGITQSTLPDPWGGIGAHGVPPSRASPLAFPQGSPPAADPWGPPEPAAPGLYPALGAPDPWAGPPASPPADPFSPGSPARAQPGHNLLAAGWTGETNGSNGASGSPAHLAQAANPWDLSGLDPMGGAGLGARPKTHVEALLGEHSNLVNLDNLTQAKPANQPAKNPFATEPANPFQAAAAPRPTMNQLMTGNQAAPPMGQAWPESQQSQQPDNPFF